VSLHQLSLYRGGALWIALHCAATHNPTSYAQPAGMARRRVTRPLRPGSAPGATRPGRGGCVSLQIALQIGHTPPGAGLTQQPDHLTPASFDDHCRQQPALLPVVMPNELPKNGKSVGGNLSPV